MRKVSYILSVSLMFLELANGFQTGVVRLVRGNGPYEGRVEIYMAGQWGTVDDDPWDNDDAGVVCRQLGYLFGGHGFRSAHFGQGTGPIWLDSIGCIGSETNLLACPHETDTSKDFHSEDVGVACNGEIRLVGGSSDYEGRVEILLNGQWGTIDDDPWKTNDANVVCRQLGYPFGGVAYRGAHFGEGSGPIWLDGINCQGHEAHLLQCTYGTDTSEDSHDEDVGVSCTLAAADVCSRCANGGQCVNQVTSYICVCPEGYHGTRCENDPCNSQPCENDGSCINNREDYICICPSGFEGRLCQTDADVCSSQPCANGGQCVNQVPSYICVCPEGYNGTRCENVIDPCENHPCEHNGLCIKENNHYLCICPDGFQGRRCESDIDPCRSEECTSSGDCVQRLNHRFCSCKNILNDTILCKYEINPCFSSPCKDSEECLSEGSRFECVTTGNSFTIGSGTWASYLPLVVALCAFLVAVICLVKVIMVSRDIKQQRHSSAPVLNDDHVQMNVQPNQYGGKKVPFDGCNKQQQGASCPMTSFDNFDDQDIYENYT